MISSDLGFCRLPVGIGKGLGLNFQGCCSVHFVLRKAIYPNTFKGDTNQCLPLCCQEINCQVQNGYPILYYAMKTLLQLFTSLFLLVEVGSGDSFDGATVVVGKEAEDVIIQGTVLSNYSTEVQYGVKHYYVVYYRGYEWLCEQATYKIACYLEPQQ